MHGIVKMISYKHGLFLDSVDSIDSELLRTWRNHPKIRHWCRQYNLISDLEQKQWFEKQSSDPSIQMFIIKQSDTSDQNRYRNMPIGVCGLTSIDNINGRAEFSLYIAPNYQKKGMGKNALLTLFRYGFEELRLHQIWGETFDGNRASKLFESIGMHKDGTRRDFYFKGGKYIDAHLYSITCIEFHSRHTPMYSNKNFTTSKNVQTDKTKT